MPPIHVAAALHSDRHAAAGEDPVMPEDIGAATRADLDVARLYFTGVGA